VKPGRPLENGPGGRPGDEFDAQHLPRAVQVLAQQHGDKGDGRQGQIRDQQVQVGRAAQHRKHGARRVGIRTHIVTGAFPPQRLFNYFLPEMGRRLVGSAPPPCIVPGGKLVDLGPIPAYTREFSNLFCTLCAHCSRSLASGYRRLRCQRFEAKVLVPGQVVLVRVIHVVSLLDL
jgi:hypothetical protein